jgi:hypothetical protein
VCSSGTGSWLLWGGECCTGEPQASKRHANAGHPWTHPWTSFFVDESCGYPSNHATEPVVTSWKCQREQRTTAAAAPYALSVQYTPPSPTVDFPTDVRFKYPSVSDCGLPNRCSVQIPLRLRLWTSQPMFGSNTPPSPTLDFPTDVRFKYPSVSDPISLGGKLGKSRS